MSAPDVIPLEVWNAEVDGRILHDWQDDASFPWRLATLVRSLVRGRVQPTSGAPPDWFRQLGAIVLAGGAARATHLEVLRAAGLHALRLEDPIFGPVRAGFGRGPTEVDLCADVGQTSIKLFDGRHAWRLDRDPARAPVRSETPPSSRAEARAQTLRFIADALRSRGRPRRVRLALPCELPEGAPASCTYCWDDPDPAWPGELAALLDLETDALELLNDAVLAAWAAADHPGIDRRRPVLVLTLGFGVGAAILEPLR